ncbi:WRKY transcription factor WRKY24 [Iris pallida]|uniref:WRKY transcription factor WRKY24 n=1 Tax=Iris pallida TaxID=29817 RepID=A0AAX6G369_IRIPA|nr:WRKY transcription factor WRKY24 [Iris pallida]
MASSTGSLETSANSRPNHTNSFSFSSSFPTSFSELLTGGAGGVDNLTSDHEAGSRISMSRGVGIPKFKSLPPLPFRSLPLPSPLPPTSPSRPGSAPPNSSTPRSPLFFNQILPSPTTGTIPLKSHNWKPNLLRTIKQQQGIKEEERNFSDFSFQTNNNKNHSFQPTHEAYKEENQSWNYQEATTIRPSVVLETEQARIICSSSSPNQFDRSCGSPDSEGAKEVRRWIQLEEVRTETSQREREPEELLQVHLPELSDQEEGERSLDGQITEIV